MMKELGRKLKKKDIKELQKELPKIPLYYYECNECFYNWESNEEYNNQSYCPRCMCGDLHCEEISE